MSYSKIVHIEKYWPEIHLNREASISLELLLQQGESNQRVGKCLCCSGLGVVPTFWSGRWVNELPPWNRDNEDDVWHPERWQPCRRTCPSAWSCPRPPCPRDKHLSVFLFPNFVEICLTGSTSLSRSGRSWAAGECRRPAVCKVDQTKIKWNRFDSTSKTDRSVKNSKIEIACKTYAGTLIIFIKYYYFIYVFVLLYYLTLGIAITP